MQRDEFQIKTFPNLPGLSVSRSKENPLRVCIATEEIFGPVRNGGIASTYYHLARTLVNDGHSVTVLYLKGNKCENKTVSHWVDFYENLDIRFVPLPEASFELICASPRWQRSMYEFYLWLKNEKPYDVVHTSEWRGGAYYALLAKRMRLAFEQTLFLVKTSSPWIWNRHYRMLPLGDKAELARMYPERRVVELADIVIGGSAHLLTFMQQKGYRLPVGRTFVQPNIIDLQDLDVEEKRPHYKYGDRVKTGEIVFFGRLESRKGLDIFCEAISRIVKLGLQPTRVTFLGKKGERLPAHPEINSLQFVRRQAKRWPFPVEIIDSYDQDKAIGYLCASPRIAVMPSVIENSTMTVYECLVHRIPFLASDVGGTRELVGEQYHDRVLIEPHPESLSEALLEVLRNGGTVAEGAFDYLENLSAWRGFHRFLADTLMEKKVDEFVADLGAAFRNEDPTPPGACKGGAHTESLLSNVSSNLSPPKSRVSVCIYHYSRPDYLESLLNSLQPQSSEIDEIVIVNDGLGEDVSGEVRQHMAERFASLDWKVVEQPHRCVGPALNAAAGQSEADMLVFLNTERHICKPTLIGTLRRAASASPAAAFTCCHSVIEDRDPLLLGEDRVHALPLGGDLATGFYQDGVFGGSCFAVRRDAFAAVGGFYEGYHLGGIEQEFQARLSIAGHELDVIPEVLYRERNAKPMAPINQKSKEYLAIRPYLQGAPYYMENVMLAARMLARKVEQAQAKNHVRNAESAMRQRDWRKACVLWEEMRRTFPDQPEGFARGAAAVKHAGRLEEADALARIAVKRFPNYPGGYLQLADLAMRRRDWEAACALWAELRYLFPNKTEGFVRGAAALIRAGRLDEADRVARDAVKRFPDHPGGHVQQAELAMYRRGWEAASSLWARLRRTFPESVEGFARGAVALRNAGRPAEAERIRRLTPRKPEPPDRELGVGTANHAIALRRHRSRVGVDRLEASLLLDPQWLAGAQKRHGSAAACVLRCNGRLVARISVAHDSQNALRVETALRAPLFGDVLYSVHDAFNEDALVSLASPAYPRAQRISGGVQSTQQAELRGWVSDPENPERARKVAIHVDGVLLDVIDAVPHNEESPTPRGATASHGFLWPIPEILASRSGTLIEVFDAGTGRPLRGSPIRLEKGRIVSAK